MLPSVVCASPQQQRWPTLSLLASYIKPQCLLYCWLASDAAFSQHGLLAEPKARGKAFSFSGRFYAIPSRYEPYEHNCRRCCQK